MLRLCSINLNIVELTIALLQDEVHIIYICANPQHLTMVSINNLDGYCETTVSLNIHAMNLRSSTETGGRSY